MKKVIDGDYMVILETFDTKDSDIIKDKYEIIGNWEEVEFDSNGDLILYKEI